MTPARRRSKSYRTGSGVLPSRCAQGLMMRGATPVPQSRVVPYGPIITSVRIWKTNGNSTEGVKVITGLGDKDLGAMTGRFLCTVLTRFGVVFGAQFGPPLRRNSSMLLGRGDSEDVEGFLVGAVVWVLRRSSRARLGLGLKFALIVATIKLCMFGTRHASRTERKRYEEDAK
jgi:hypothetical protein